MLIMSAEEVRRALPMTAAIEAMRDAFVALAEGDAQAPLRSHLTTPDGSGTTLVMPARLSDALTVKVVSIFGGNPARGLPRIQATVLVMNPETGEAQALLEGATLTALRTGATSGLATDLLARPDAHVVSIFGAGVQGRTQLEAVCTVREIERVLVCDPECAAVERFCAELAGRGPIPDDVRGADAQEAAAEAEIICTATISTEPVLDDADLRAGVHINAVGSYQPHVREIPAATVIRARLIVDDREAALEETGDLIQPIAAGEITPDHIHATLGELLLGRRDGRESQGEVTLFKSVGSAVCDAAASRAALRGYTSR
jgi:ornithine cyclodeaminase/alanine dehydrogenase-like protein (mu-crystallin family)